MPTTTYTQRCLTCNHPVNPADPQIGLIKMANQPRYYHLDSQGCQEAERKPYDYVPMPKRISASWDDYWVEEETRIRQKNEKEEMPVTE